MHYQITEDHGFTAIADYDYYLVLSHFKGHSMVGFGGAIKNISIGLGSSEGKCWIHSGGTSLRNRVEICKGLRNNSGAGSV